MNWMNLTMQVARIISSLLAAGILQMRGVEGKTGWFWLFLIDGLLTFVIGLLVCFTLSINKQRLINALQSYFYLPSSPTNTKSLLYPRSWYTEREEVIMINVRSP